MSILREAVLTAIIGLVMTMTLLALDAPKWAAFIGGFLAAYAVLPNEPRRRRG